MILCTECYIQQEGKILMLYRNKKEHDINEGKWLGVGGKFEPGESPEQCLLREVKEETGVTLTAFKLHGVMTFVTLDGSSEPLYIFIFTASAFSGEVGECNEGTLAWIDTDKVADLERWEGDRLFWDWIQQDAPFFSAYFEYDGDRLQKHSVTFYDDTRVLKSPGSIEEVRAQFQQEMKGTVALPGAERDGGGWSAHVIENCF